jgi:hypothetical protein
MTPQHFIIPMEGCRKKLENYSLGPQVHSTKHYLKPTIVKWEKIKLRLLIARLRAEFLQVDLKI